MTQFNSRNERIKRSYVRFLREADQKAESTTRAVEKSLSRYEVATDFADFDRFDADYAVGFKKALAEGGLSRATIHATVNAVRAFFRWLAMQPGHKSRILRTDIEYLKLSAKDVRAAKAPGDRDIPTLAQVRKVIDHMPWGTEVERRDRALITFTLLTGMRDRAIASLRLKHVDLDRMVVRQDPNEVSTKFSKRIDTFLVPLGMDLEAIVVEWVRYLRDERLFGQNDPVFPRTAVGHDAEMAFAEQGVEPVFWQTASPIREIFKRAFTAAGVPYFSPHTLRHTLTQLVEKAAHSPESFMAFAQNLGHENPLTTFTSYGRVAVHRQGEVIRSLRFGSGESDLRGLAEELVARLRERA
jgi:integrase/recombinase XerD